MGRFKDYINGKIKDEEEKETSDTGVSKLGNFARYAKEAEFGLDTLEADLNTIGTRTNELFGSWQTAETMNNYKATVQKLYDRLGAYEDYRKNAGADLGLTDLSEIRNNYKTILDSWDEQVALYGNYKNADAFNTAVKNSKLAKQFEGLSYERVQGLMRKYDVGSDEYNYLKNYTGYTNLEDFELASKGSNLAKQLLDKAKEYQGNISYAESKAEQFEKRSKPLTNDGGWGAKATDAKNTYNEWLKSTGYSSYDEMVADLEDEIKYGEELERAKNVWKLDNPLEGTEYADIVNKKDFATNSKYVSTKSNGFWENASSQYNLGYNDLAYEYINNQVEGIREEINNQHSIYNKESPIPKPNMREKGYELLTDEEIAVYNYLHSQDPKKADEFLKYMEEALGYRIDQNSQANIDKMLEEGGVATNVLLSALTIGSNQAASFYGGLEAIVNKATGEEYNPYSYYNNAISTSADIRSGIADEIANATEGVEVLGVNVPSFVYNTFMSAADSAVGGATFGGAHTAFMGYSAFQQKVKELTEAGESDEVIYGNAIVAGLLEAGFEYVGFDHLMNMKSTDDIARVFVNALKQAGVEGLEEFGTEVGNIIADYAFRGDRSQFISMYNDLIERGYSEKEASAQVAVAMATQIGEATLGGMIGAGPRAFVTSSGQYFDNVSTGKDIRSGDAVGTLMTEIEGMTDKEAEAYKLYTEYANRGITAENISNAKLGNLYNTAKAEATEGYRTASRDVARAEGIIDKQTAVIDSKTASEGKKARAVAKLDEAVYNQRDAQFRRFDSAEALGKLSNVDNKVVTTAIDKAEAKRKADHEAEVKELSSGVEVSVMADSDKAIEIKGMKDDKTLITNEGEVAINDLKLSDRDAELITYAKNMSPEIASLYLESYDGSADIEQYNNDFELVATMAKHKYSQDELLKAKGVLSANAVSNIYTAMVSNKVREEQQKIDTLNEAMGNTMSVSGVIDDSIIDYDSKSVKDKVNWNSLDSRQRQAIVYAKGFAKAMGINLKFIADGVKKGINGSYDRATNTIVLDVYAGINQNIGAYKDTIIPTMSHEVTHWMKDKAPEIYQKLGEKIFATLAMEGEGYSEFELIQKEKSKQASRGRNFTDEQARDEIIARACEDLLSMSEKGKEMFASLSETEQKTLIDKIKELIGKVKNWIDGLLNTYSSDREEAKILQKYADDLSEILKMWEDMLVSSKKANASMEEAGVWDEARKATEKVGVGIDAKTKSAYPLDEMYSERTWTESEYVQNRDVAVKALVKAIGVTEADARRYIDNINSIARLIADDRVRLDYEPNIDSTASVLKSNSEYKWTLDMSTLCAKRLLTTGTFDAIQKALPNTVFNSEDIVSLREMMLKRGYEVACGICYVESTRRELGPITEEFINRYKESQRTGKPIQRINSEKKYVDLKKTKDQMLTTVDKSTEYFYADKDYTPTLAELNTTDIDLVKRDHPLVYEAYLNFMNARGQAKPKLLETRAEYKGDILKHFNKNAVRARNAAGGLRVQSFSDFEIAHLIDMMQAVLDMSRVGLKSQAYTKVPAFADVFGGTGMKINLSLIAKGSGLDENGNLIFDDIEGINHKEAFRLREKYSKNVGTILVGKNDAHIIAAMADPRIDFIIPFHKSSWKESLYEALGLEGYSDYTETQNEKPIDKDREIKNFQPSEYWDYSKSGDENAQIYLEKCKEDGRIPKFPQFQGYPGYWKLLIDFKMYDNDGIGSPQEVVRPDFDMDSATEIMNSYEGGHRSLPVAQDVVKDFVAEYKKNHPMDDGDVLVQNSDRDDDLSAFEVYGELDRVTKERDALIEDIKLLRDKIKLEGKVTDGKYFTDSSILNFAGKLLRDNDSGYDKVELARRLKRLYFDMASGNVNDTDLWNSVMAIASDVVSYAKPRVVKNNYASDLLKEIKGTKVRLNQIQKAEAKSIFGSRWVQKMFEKIIISDNATSELDQQWQEWAERYPNTFNVNVKDGNQVRELLGIIDALKNQSNMVEEYNESEYATYLATEILGGTWELKPMVTTADKYTEKIKDLKAKHKDTISKLRDDYNARVEKAKLAEQMFYGRQMNEMRNEHKAKLAEERKKASAKVDEVRAELREDYNARLDERMLAERMHFGKEIAELRRTKKEQVAEAKELGRQKMAEYKENAQKKTKIQSITSRALELSKKLKLNSKDKHIPDALKGPVIELLQAIDFSSKQLLGISETYRELHGTPDKNDAHISEALRNVKDAIVDDSQKAEDFIAELYGSGIDEELKNLVKKVDGITKNLKPGEFILQKMSLEELNKLSKIIQTFSSAVNQLNQFHTMQRTLGIDQAAERSINELAEMEKVYDDDKKHFDKLKTKVYWNNLTPYYAFKNLGNTLHKLFESFMNAQDKIAFLADELITFTEKLYTDKDYEKWSDTFFEFEAVQPDGKTKKFSMNVPQIMSLYCLYKQEDAKRHLLYGKADGKDKGKGKGITITETDKTRGVTKNILLSEADVDNIISKIKDVKNIKGDKTAIEVADALQEFMNRRGAELGNEISMARWGIKSFGIENYFPIKVSKGTVRNNKDVPGVNTKSMLALLNSSFTHARNEFAAQSIEIGDIFDIFSGHMSDMIRYNALALPILDMYRLMNKTFVDKNGNEHSFENAVTDTFGEHAWNYVRTFLYDVNGESRGDERDGLMVKFFKNSKIAKVAGNLRVWLLQYTSFFRASAVMDDKYLWKTFHVFFHAKKAKERAKEHCGIAKWKSLGFYSVDISRNLTEQIKHTKSLKNKAVELSLKGVEKADERTMAVLWTACELEIRDKRKDLEVGSDEFYEAVNERLREVVYRTQVVDSVMTRSQIMRSTGTFDKMLTAFGSENALSFNLMTDVFVTMKLEERKLSKNMDKKDAKKLAREKHGRYARKAITAYVVTNLVSAALQTMFDAFRDYDEEEKDEEYFLKLMIENFLLNSSFINKLPGINSLVSTMQGFTTSRGDADWMAYLYKTYEEIAKNGFTEKVFKNVLRVASDVSGIAGYNIYRDAKAFYEMLND